VWRRDGGPVRLRGLERQALHRAPPSSSSTTASRYAVGGEATVANISLRCRAHNTYEAVKALGSAGTARGTLGIAPNGPRRQLAPGRVGPMLQGATRPPAPRSRGMAATASGDVVAT